MQSEETTPTNPEAARPQDRALEGRTTASDRQCKQCGEPLTGRKLRFCSDRCRMRHVRQNRWRTLNTLIDLIERALRHLREEVTS
jgi:hypothetical protein